MVEPGRYFLRIRGEISGPFTREQVVSRVHTGQVTTVHWLSSDGTDWVLARDVEWLFPEAGVDLPDGRATAAMPLARAPGANGNGGRGNDGRRLDPPPPVMLSRGPGADGADGPSTTRSALATSSSASLEDVAAAAGSAVARESPGSLALRREKERLRRLTIALAATVLILAAAVALVAWSRLYRPEWWG